MSANFQQLSLQKEDQDSPPEEDNTSVVIPHHLQLHTPDCFHLSFGSFGSGTNANFSGSGAFPNSNVEESSAPADVSSVAHSEARYLLHRGYYFLLSKHAHTHTPCQSHDINMVTCHFLEKKRQSS